MRHLTQDELVLLNYGELSDPDWEQAKEHLRACDRCREELLSLESALKAVEALPVPERGENYGREVWARISPRLEAKIERRPGFFLPVRAWVFSGTVAALLVVAFWSGRWWQQRRTDTATTISASAQQRILMLAVADHLERAQVLLVEVMHQEAGNSPRLCGRRNWRRTWCSRTGFTARPRCAMAIRAWPTYWTNWNAFYWRYRTVPARLRPTTWRCFSTRLSPREFSSKFA